VIPIILSKEMKTKDKHMYINSLNKKVVVREWKDREYNIPVFQNNRIAGYIHNRYLKNYRRRTNSRQETAHEAVDIDEDGIAPPAAQNRNSNESFIALLKATNNSVETAWEGWNKNTKWMKAAAYLTNSSVPMTLLMIIIALYCIISCSNSTNQSAKMLLNGLLPLKIVADFPGTSKMMKSHLKLFQTPKANLIYFVNQELGNGYEEFILHNKKREESPI